MAGDYRFPQVTYGKTVEETVENLMGAVTILRKELQYHMNNLDSNNITQIDASVTNVIGMTSTMVAGSGITLSDYHYYVASSGSDTNVGTSDAPFATVQHAIDSIPSLSAFAEVIIKGGVYPEYVQVWYKRPVEFFSIYGEYNAELAMFPVIEGLDMRETSPAQITNISVDSTQATNLYIESCWDVHFTDFSAVSTAYNPRLAINILQNSKVIFEGLVTQLHKYGLWVDYGCTVSLANATIQAEQGAVSVLAGSIVGLENGCSVSGTSGYTFNDGLGGLVIDLSTGTPGTLRY